MLRIRVLGELAVEGSRGPLELSGSWRARSLLAWFALEPGSHPRGDVAARFWPDVLDSSARASLRNALWAMRRAMGEEAGDALIATRDHVGLAAPPVVWVDATAFAEHVAAGELEEALELSRGELLAGLDEEWVHEHRDRHREGLSVLLERVAATAEAEGDLAGAIAATRRRVRLDRLDEDAQRALIARLARSGDRAGALAAYERLRERFRRELGLSLSDETRAVISEVRDGPARAEPARSGIAGRAEDASPQARGAWRPGRLFPLPPRLRRRAPTALVGRERELSVLRELWRGVRAGEGVRLALVTGEAGMGKSRLVRELALEAREQGSIVLHGWADEDLLVPHQHLVSALEHLIAVAAPDELARRLGPRAADLEPVAPGVSALTGSSGEPVPPSSRYRLFEAVAGVLDELSAETPALLLIDDLHWADQATAAILRHALEARPEMRVLVLATQREADVPTVGPVAEALQRLGHGQYAERLFLSGLSDPEVAELAEGLSGRDLDGALVRALRTETAGNPFFVQEIVRDLSESDRSASVLSLAQAEVPDRVRDVVNLRLGRLGEASLNLLAVAAVIGVEFELAPLERVSDLDGEDVAVALDEALRAALLTEAVAGDRESFSFSHALVRRTVLGRLTRLNRRRIHARVADALEATRGEDALLEIAHHLCEALPVADRERALDYATRAAEQATAGLAYAEAVELFTRALSILPTADRRRRALALKRAVAYQGLFHTLMDAGSAEPRLRS